MSVSTALMLGQVLVLIVFTLRLTPLWREKSHLRGRVYMHRRGAFSWLLIAWMNALLLVAGVLSVILEPFVSPFSWFTLAIAVGINGSMVLYSVSNRRIQLAMARYYEEREIGRVVVPDSPEGLS